MKIEILDFGVVVFYSLLVCEEWKTIPQFENYEVSSLGRIRYKETGRLRKFQTHRRGYSTIKLRGQPGDKTMFVHKIVAMTFLGPNTSGTVNHKNFNKTDNRVENLEYMTIAENISHARKAGRIPPPLNSIKFKKGHKRQQGVLHSRARLTEDDIRAIRSSVKATKEIALEFNVCRKHINEIISRKRWAHIK